MALQDDLCVQISTPAAPTSGASKVYVKSGGAPYVQNSAGLEQPVATNLPLTNQTSNYGALSSDGVIAVSAASGSVTVTLPTAVGCTGQVYTVVRTDTTYANSVTVATTSSQTINGATTFTLLWAQYTFVTVISNGSNWYVIGRSAINEPWQTYSLNATVAQASGNGANGFFYRRTVDNMLEMAYDIKCNATTGNIGSSALSSTYFIASSQNIECGQYGTATLSGGLPHLLISTAGVVSLAGIASTSVSLYGNARVALEAL